MEYTGKPTTGPGAKSKSEGNSVSEVSIPHQASNGSLIRGHSSLSAMGSAAEQVDRKYYNAFMGTESEFGYASSNLLIKRVDSMYNGCEIESPTDSKKKVNIYSESGARTTSYKDLSPSRKRWRKMSTIFKTIYFLKNPQVKRIENPQVLVEELKNQPSRKSYTSHSSTAALNTVSVRLLYDYRDVPRML